MNNLKINHLAVFACILLLHALGFLWYGALFGERWMELVELDPERMEGSGEAGIWITNFIASTASVYLLAWLFTKMNVQSGLRGAVIAFLITFCIYHLTIMRDNMFAGYHYGLAWIVGGFSLVGLTLSGFILGAWRREGA